ncbi:Programmed cell death 1 ligand 1 [Manis javanica]|nr:Programmed cell death 1 ligand 1 [Manis javanica]
MAEGWKQVGSIECGRTRRRCSSQSREQRLESPRRPPPVSPPAGHSRKMRIFSIFIFMAYDYLLKAFTITVTKDLYMVEYGSNVTLECKFPVGKQLDLLALIVYWKIEDKKIIQFVNGKEDLKVQHSSYNQRAQLCGGADYKRITLKVNAPYRTINQRISVDPVTSEHELMCQAEGYPEAEVTWTSSDQQVLSGKTTITNSKREEKLFNVTSTLRTNTTANEIFYCTFRRSGLEENSTAELVIPEPLLVPGNKRIHWVTLGAVFFFLGVALTVIIYLKRDVKLMDVEKCGTQDTNSRKQNDTQFEETCVEKEPTGKCGKGITPVMVAGEGRSVGFCEAVCRKEKLVVLFSFVSLPEECCYILISIKDHVPSPANFEPGNEASSDSRHNKKICYHNTDRNKWNYLNLWSQELGDLMGHPQEASGL